MTPSPQPVYTPPASRQPAAITHIVDVDRVAVEIEGDTVRLRYIGMDTPERGRPFYSEAPGANRQMVVQMM